MTDWDARSTDEQVHHEALRDHRDADHEPDDIDYEEEVDEDYDSDLLTYTCSSFEARITKDFKLIWHDHGPNGWSEQYQYLSTAMARLALLVACVEEGAMFKGGGDAFLSAWIKMRRTCLA